VILGIKLKFLQVGTFTDLQKILKTPRTSQHQVQKLNSSKIINLNPSKFNSNPIFAPVSLKLTPTKSGKFYALDSRVKEIQSGSTQQTQKAVNELHES
jgi:hypothetical protein